MHLFVLCSPRVKRELSIEKVSGCFSKGEENSHGKKTSHGRAAAKKEAKAKKDSARIGEFAEGTSLGGGGQRGMDVKHQFGTAMVCAQLGHLKQQKMRVKAETV